VYDPETERMPPLIPQNLREHHRSKRGEGLTELIIGAKKGQPADMDMSTHLESLLVRSRSSSTHTLCL
jgi:hypothetical protein